MLDPNVVMRRALRWVCDQHSLAHDNLHHLPSTQRAALQELVIEIADDMRYNQLRYFRPFDHQRRFFVTGASPRRGILAANRIGKTVSTCYESHTSRKDY